MPKGKGMDPDPYIYILNKGHPRMVILTLLYLTFETGALCRLQRVVRIDLLYFLAG